MSSISSVFSSSSSAFASTLLASKNNTNFEDFDLTQLKDKTLDDFFLYHDKSLTFEEKKIKEIVNLKSTDLFHYIWMGNPLPEKYIKNILKLKALYPDKKFILWVDEQALKYPEILKFAKDNNICLVLLSDVFKEKYNFELDEILQIEKNRLPSNWGAISDIYRYLIMYYFAGTYLDTDRNPDKVDIFKFKTNLETLPKISIIAKGNDIIIVKERKTQFFKNIFETINETYKDTYNYKELKNLINILDLPKSFRCALTILRTGPSLFSPGNTKSLFDVNYIKIEEYISDMGWRGTLTPQVIDKLIKKPDIELNIALNIIQELKERQILNLIRYDAIIDKLSFEARKRILDKVNSKLQEFLKEKTDFEIQHLIAKNKEEYQKFINLIPDKNKKIESLPVLAIKKAIKTKNIEMLKFLINSIDKEKFNKENELSDDLSYLIAKAFLDDKEILNVFINEIVKKNISIDLQNIIYHLIKISTVKQISTINPKDLDTFIDSLKNKNLLPNDFKLEDLITKVLKNLVKYHSFNKISENKQLCDWFNNKLPAEHQEKFDKYLLDNILCLPFEDDEKL